MMSTIFPKGDKLPADYFTGNAFLQPLQARDQNNEFVVGSVTFEPGARTNWHKHPKGQTLIVTEGEGFYQEEGKKARIIRKGDVITIPEKVVHWHGATAHARMIHIAITNYEGDINAVWLQPVSEKEYSEVNSIFTAHHALDSRQQSIVVLSALTATGDLATLKAQINTGLEAGLSISEIREVFVQLYAYCGFPRSLNAINTFMQVLEERKAKGITDPVGQSDAVVVDHTDKYERGRERLETLTNTAQQKPAPGFGVFAPRVDQFLKEHLFADIFDCEVLSYQQRELVTISALAAMTGVSAQLNAHINMGKHTGITIPQLLHVAALVGQYISSTQADNMIQILK